jgi:hypothetical protein
VFGSVILDVAIGVIFLYLLLSLICSTITEGIARVAAMRSSNLQEGIRNLLNDPKGSGLAKKLYDHALIKGLYRAGWFDRLSGRDGKPSYIPSRTFTLALLDTIAGTGKKFDQVRTEVAKIDNQQVKGALLPLLDEAKDLKEARKNVEGWYDDVMERVSGWYKRKAQVIIVAVALLLSVALNVDTFAVVNALWHDTALRESVVAAAQRSSEQPLPNNIETIKQQLNALQLPIGWQSVPSGAFAWLTKVVGLLFTALALSLGAPFWFDALNKLVRVRSSGTSPDTSSSSSS